MARPNGICADCGEPVLYAITAAGRRQALNPDPDQDGNTAVRHDAAGAWRARVPDDDLPTLPWERIYMPHPATCSRRLVRAAAPTAPVVPAAAAQPDKLRAWNGEVVLSLTDYRRRRRTRKR